MDEDKSAGVLRMVRESPYLAWSLLGVLRLRQLRTGAAPVKAVYIDG